MIIIYYECGFCAFKKKINFNEEEKRKFCVWVFFNVNICGGLPYLNGFRKNSLLN